MNSSSLHRTSRVLLLAYLVLFAQIIHSSVAQTPRLTLTMINPRQPDMITITCQGVAGSITFTFTYPDGSPEVMVTRSSPSYTFTVTPNNETTVTCRKSRTSPPVSQNSITFSGETNLISNSILLLELKCFFW